jgi:DNA repair protein RecO (recombination protein O)
MPLHDAEAVVLRHYPLAEADRIVVLFTREQGKVRAVAGGARKTSSRLSAALEPLSHLHLQLYGKEGSELLRIRQCELLHSYLGKDSSPERLCALSYFAELTLEFIQENNPAPLLFRLLLALMDVVEKRGIHEALVRYFELWLLKLNGLLPDYGYCSACGRCVKGNGFFAAGDSGRGMCADCAQGGGVPICAAAGDLILDMLKRPPADFASRSFSVPAGRDLEKITQRLLLNSLEKRLKAYTGLKEILRNG